MSPETSPLLWRCERCKEAVSLFVKTFPGWYCAPCWRALGCPTVEWPAPKNSRSQDVKPSNPNAGGAKETRRFDGSTPNLTPSRPGRRAGLSLASTNSSETP